MRIPFSQPRSQSDLEGGYASFILQIYDALYGTEDVRNTSATKLAERRRSLLGETNSIVIKLQLLQAASDKYYGIAEYDQVPALAVYLSLSKIVIRLWYMEY